MTLPAISYACLKMPISSFVRAKTGAPYCHQPAPLRHARDWMTKYTEVWEQQFARLDALLKKDQHEGGGMTHPTNVERDGDSLVLTRLFDAPRDAVFKAWTDPERVQHWFGCVECTSVRTTIDLCVGGEFRNLMQIENCGEVNIIDTISELDPPNRFGYTTPGGPGPEGMPAMSDTTTIAEFREVSSNQTGLRVTVTGLAEPYDQIVSGGWRACISKLGSHLGTEGASA